MGGGKELGIEIEENLKTFKPIKKLNFFTLLKLKLDIVDSYLNYGATPQEYFLFDFYDSNKTRRSEFLTNQYKDRKMIDLVGFEENWFLLEDKSIFYNKFKDFFYRDVCIVRTEYDKKVFLEFCSKHKKFIAKPINGQCGKGIEIYECIELETLFNNFINSGVEWILEELIMQDVEMVKWNQSSVNTVRLPCFMTNEGFKVLKPFIRVGREGAIVDNGNSGGIFAVINKTTGVIESNGMDIRGNLYSKHPDSDRPFIGYQIPKWTELLNLAEKIHSVISYYPYVGWDFALTEKGWVLIEGNWGQFNSEFVDREGIKKKFDTFINDRL